MLLVELVLGGFGRGEVDAVGDVAFAHAPVEEAIEEPYAIFLLDDPQSVELIILSHFSDVVLDEVVDVLAEEVHVVLAQHFLVIFGIHDKLQEQHEQQVEGLELSPRNFGAHVLRKLEQSVRHADVAVGDDGGSTAGIQVDVHFRKHIDLVQVRLVQLLVRHLVQNLHNLLDCDFGERLPAQPLLLRFWREEGFTIDVLIAGLGGLLQVLLVALGLDGRTTPFFVEGGGLGDLAGSLSGRIVTLPSCFCLMWVKSAA